MKVLMIDDDEELGEALRPVLGRYGIELIQSNTPHAGLELLQTETPDVLLLDMMLPEMDGMSVCRHVRTSTDDNICGMPIVALTARADLTDKVAGLESGIDDYIAKPVEVRELVARLRAISRKRFSPHQTVQEAIFHLDKSRLECSWAGVQIPLTDLEMQVLQTLESARGIVLSRMEILTRIRHTEKSDPAVVDAIIYRIRRKFRAEGVTRDFIYTVRGRGYRV